MKRLIFTLMIMLSLGASAQDSTFLNSGIPYTDGSITYEIIDTIPGASQELIFSAFKAAVIDNFKNAAAVIQAEDKEAGKMMLKGTASYVFQGGVRQIATAQFSATLMAKDGRYRIQLQVQKTGHTFVAPEFPGSKAQMRWRVGALAAFNERMQQLMQSIQRSIIKSAKSDNW